MNVFMYVCMCVYIYVYTYMYERERIFLCRFFFCVCMILWADALSLKTRREGFSMHIHGKERVCERDCE